jgi:hypothetical protein
MNNMNNLAVHPEPVEGCRSWFDKPVLSELFILRGPQDKRRVEGLTMNGRCHMRLFKLFVRRPLKHYKHCFFKK